MVMQLYGCFISMACNAKGSRTIIPPISCASLIDFIFSCCEVLGNLLLEKHHKAEVLVFMLVPNSYVVES